MPQITFTVEGLKEIQAKYKALGKSFSPGSKVVKALLKKFQVIMYSSIAKNFGAEGRPSKWKALQASTLAARRHGKKARLGAGRILQDTGRLRMSVTAGKGPGSVSRLGSMAIEFGTRLAYAAAHQFGFTGSQSVSPFVRKQASRDTFGKVDLLKNGALVRKRIRTGMGIAYVRAFVRDMNLPKREFLVIQKEDSEQMKKTLVDHFRAWDKANRVKAK